MRGRTFIGILFVILGTLFLLDKLEIIKFATLVSMYWPVILIAIGVNQLYSKGHSSKSAIILIFIGGFFQLKILGLLPSDIGKYLWPTILIVIGLFIIFERPKKKDNLEEYIDDIIDHFVVFSGLENKCISRNFTGGSATVAFGGIDLDLRQAELSQEGAFLELTAVFGGIEVKVPDHWRVVVKGTPIFGAWENKVKTSVGDIENQPVLEIKCLVMFGGIDILN